MKIKKFSDFIDESKRYFHGEFSNFYEIVQFIEYKYDVLKKLSKKYPELKEDLKTVRFYLEFKYDKKPQKVYIQFGPWIKLPVDHVAQWRGYIQKGQDRVVLSTRYFDDRRDWISKCAILFHELVHAVDPKSNPENGKKSGELSIEIVQKGKKFGLDLKGKTKKEGIEKFTKRLIEIGADIDDLYAASPTEQDAWISELCFGLEQYLLYLEDDDRESEILKILDTIRNGDFDWTEGIVGGGGYMKRFAEKNPKFLKRLFTSIYSTIQGFSDLKRTEFRITSKADMGPRRRLKEGMDPTDYASLFMEAEAEV
jgi:hypothetical protein